VGGVIRRRGVTQVGKRGNTTGSTHVVNGSLQREGDELGYVRGRLSGTRSKAGAECHGETK